MLERRRERGSVGRRADLLIAVSSPLAEQTRRFVRQPVLVVENGFDPEEDPGSTSSVAEPPSRLRALWGATTLVYTGGLHLDFQDPTPLFRAIKALAEVDPRASSDLRMLLFGTRHDHLRTLIEREGVSDHVKIVGYVARQMALWAQRNASALVLVESQKSAARGIVRAKTFEYLQARRPILGIEFDNDTELGRIIERAGVALICGGDERRIYDFLRALLDAAPLPGFRPVPQELPPVSPRRSGAACARDTRRHGSAGRKRTIGRAWSLALWTTGWTTGWTRPRFLARE